MRRRGRSRSRPGRTRSLIVDFPHPELTARGAPRRTRHAGKLPLSRRSDEPEPGEPTMNLRRSHAARDRRIRDRHRRQRDGGGHHRIHPDRASPSRRRSTPPLRATRSSWSPGRIRRPGTPSSASASPPTNLRLIGKVRPWQGEAGKVRLVHVRDPADGRLCGSCGLRAGGPSRRLPRRARGLLHPWLHRRGLPDATGSRPAS